MNEVQRADRNLLHNLTNPYQTDAKRVLTVCSAGLLRSPSAANVLHREFGFNTRSCGVDPRYSLVPISEALIVWSDEILVMEQWMQQEIESIIEDLYGNRGFESYLETKPIIVLGISDSYGFMEDKLQELIVEKYNESERMSALQLKIAKDLNIRD